LIESIPKAYEKLRVISFPSVAWKDKEAKERLGMLLAFALGAEFAFEKNLFRCAAAKLLSQCSGDVVGLKSVIQNLYRTSWLSWARKQNSPYVLLNSVRRAWKRKQFLTEPRRRRLIETFIMEIADALEKPYEQVAWSCLQGLIVLLEMYGEEAVEEAFAFVLNSDYVKWMKTFNVSPKAFVSKVREHLAFLREGGKERKPGLFRPIGKMRRRHGYRAKRIRGTKEYSAKAPSSSLRVRKAHRRS
jgi:hypothetical protein